MTLTYCNTASTFSIQSEIIIEKNGQLAYFELRIDNTVGHCWLTLGIIGLRWGVPLDTNMLVFPTRNRHVGGQSKHEDPT